MHSILQTAPPGTLVTLDVIALDQLGRNTSAFLELLNGPVSSQAYNNILEPVGKPLYMNIPSLSLKYTCNYLQHLI